ncbi:hypothetical protein Pgy4_33236, partial [Pseudomonas savastanoi pv. glycinea str. race 4]
TIMLQQQIADRAVNGFLHSGAAASGAYCFFDSHTADLNTKYLL